jgi:hypothetical protein
MRQAQGSKTHSGFSRHCRHHLLRLQLGATVAQNRRGRRGLVDRLLLAAVHEKGPAVNELFHPDLPRRFHQVARAIHNRRPDKPVGDEGRHGPQSELETFADL